MRIRRRSLRKLLIAAGCVVGTVAWPAAGVGAALALGGGSLHLWSKGCLEQNRRLTTAGPYRWTRNPFYLANLLIDLGLCCVIGRWWLAVIYLPIWWWSYRDTILREEDRLRGLFPETFPEYVALVPRMMPTGRRLPMDRVSGGFNWQNDALARGSEYARLLGVAIAIGMIWAGEFLRHEEMAVFEPRNALALALVVAVVAAWVIKLALAETFRRPETALLPFAAQPIARSAIALLLAAGAVYLGLPWAANLPLIWCLLLILDRVGARRLAGDAGEKGQVWRYFPAIALATIGICVGLVYLGRLGTG